MLLKDKLSAEPGFQYVVDALELMSASGRRCLLAQPLLTDAQSIRSELDNVDAAASCIRNESLRQPLSVVRHQLMQMHDIQGTLDNLQHNTVLEEIELFELKNFTFLCRNTINAAQTMGIDGILAIPDTDEVFRLLDPDNTGIPNFYIYDSYHPELAPLRKELKALQTRLDCSKEDDNADLQRAINQLFDQQNAIQQQVIAQLSSQLAPFHDILQTALDRMAYTDLLLAKATLAEQWQLCRPEILDAESNENSSYSSLWNPRLKHRNESVGQRYQPIDISLSSGVCLITGANMAGKTVLLKTIGIAQLMAQFGFFVPASTARIRPVSDVAFCIGDEQNEMNGLSSFASEITKISSTLVRARSELLLILIDEPARTTNPIEGKAIVQSIATILDNEPSTTLITTHYSQLALPCRRLRVRGFVEGLVDIPLSPENINRFMDYSLLPDESDDVPQEALRIAAILQCDPEMLAIAKQKLNPQSDLSFKKNINS